MPEIIDLGRWYFAVECAGCGKHISLGQAPAPCEESTPKSFELQVICPCCGLNGIYLPAQVSWLKARAASGARLDPDIAYALTEGLSRGQGPEGCSVEQDLEHAEHADAEVEPERVQRGLETAIACAREQPRPTWIQSEGGEDREHDDRAVPGECVAAECDPRMLGGYRE